MRFNLDTQLEEALGPGLELEADDAPRVQVVDDVAEQAAGQRLALFGIPGIPQRDQARQRLDTHLQLVFDLFLLAGELLLGGTFLLALLQDTVVLGLLHVAIPEETTCRLDASFAARQRFLFPGLRGSRLVRNRVLHPDGVFDHMLKDIRAHVHQVQEPPDTVLDLITGDGPIRAAASLGAIPESLFRT